MDIQRYLGRIRGHMLMPPAQVPPDEADSHRSSQRQTTLQDLPPVRWRGYVSGGLPPWGKWWRLKYRFADKEKRLSLGVYPDVSLKDARVRRDEARKLVANGVDPSEHRKAQKAASAERSSNSFETVAREWYAKHSGNWATNQGQRIIRRLERDLFPWLAGQPLA